MKLFWIMFGIFFVPILGALLAIPCFYLWFVSEFKYWILLVLAIILAIVFIWWEIYLIVKFIKYIIYEK